MMKSIVKILFIALIFGLCSCSTQGDALVGIDGKILYGQLMPTLTLFGRQVRIGL